MLCFDGEMRTVKEDLHSALKMISEVLSDNTVEAADILVPLILC
jgi:hypothetical protein